MNRFYIVGTKEHPKMIDIKNQTEWEQQENYLVNDDGRIKKIIYATDDYMLCIEEYISYINGGLIQKMKQMMEER